MLDRLDSKDWIVVCRALNRVRQLSFFYKEAMHQILGNITPLTIMSLNNSRISLCKTVIMASSELIKVYQDQIIDFIDPMLLQLFPKTSQDKRFVCEDAEKELMMKTTCISPNLLLHKLELYVKQKNPHI